MPENAMPEARVDSHDQPERNFASNIFRYGLATIGPVGGAASQFILSVQLLHALQPSSFGSFSFLLVASQFGGGLWSALFCAPLPILLTQGDEPERRAMLRCLFVTNLALAGLAFSVFWILGTWLGTPNVASMLFAAYAAVALLRWFARAHAYAVGAPLRTITSDLLYSAVLLAGVGLIALSGSNTVELPYAALLVSAALGLLPFGWRYLDQQFIRISLRDLPRYADVWRRHSSWSLTGVVTTEATVNAHAYLVTFFFGPAAFAPVAASALIIRPIGVVMNAVTDFERPDLARQIDDSRLGGVMRSIRAFRVVLIAAWVATAIAAAGLMTYAPGLIFPSHYDSAYLATGAALWMAVAGIRLLRTPEGTLLQAAGAFRSLAYASIGSSVVSVAAVAVVLAAGGPMWSIVGILFGEAVIAAWIWRAAQRWWAAYSTTRAPPHLEDVDATIPASGN